MSKKTINLLSADRKRQLIPYSIRLISFVSAVSLATVYVVYIAAGANTTIGNNISTSGTLTVGNTALFSGTLRASSTLQVTGSTTLYTALTVSGTGTSTFANGLNLSGGCFAVNGTCVTGGGGGGSGTVNSGTQGQVAFYDTTGTAVSGTSTLVVATTSKVGIGTSNPLSALDVRGDGIIRAQVESSSAGLSARAFGSTGATAAGVFGRRARGTEASPTAVQSGDNLLIMNGRGHDGTDFPSSSNVSVSLQAAGTFSTTSNPTRILFATTPTGSTVSQTRLFIGPSGSVGIGTTNPSGLLDVQGDALFTGTVTINTSNVNGLALTYANPFSGIDTSVSGHGITIENSDTTDGNTQSLSFSTRLSDLSTVQGASIQAVNVSHNSSAPSVDLAFVTRSSSVDLAERMRISANGKVGIGTASPAWNLQVAGTRPFIALSDTAAGTNLKHWTLSSQGGDFYIATSSDSFATSTFSIFRINGSNGNTAIGIPSGGVDTQPGARLQVFGNAIVSSSATGASNVIIAQNPATAANNNEARTTFRLRNSAASLIDYASVGGLAEDITSSLGALIFTTRTSGSLTEKARIDSSGNVGIGTTSPSQKLAVQGNALFSGDLSLANLTATGSIKTGTTTTIESGTIFAQNGLYVGDGQNAISFTKNNGSYGVFYEFNDSGNRTIGLAALSDAGGYVFSDDSASAQWMVLRNGGKLGVGTTSPGTLLSLHSGSEFINFGVTSTSTFSKGINLLGGCIAINGTCVGAGGGGSGTVNNGTQGQVAFYDANGTAVSGTSTLAISTASRVGVGTTSPTGQLHVHQASSGLFPAALIDAPNTTIGSFPKDVNLAVVTSDAQGAGKGGTIGLGGNVQNASGIGDNTFIFGAIRGAKENSNAPEHNGYLGFYTIADFESLKENMRLSSAGFLGIGTTSPMSMFSVQNVAGPTLAAKTSTSTITLAKAVSGDEPYWAQFGLDGTDTNGLQMPAWIGTQSLDAFSLMTSGVERVRITASGNVGIGTTTSITSSTTRLFISDGNATGTPSISQAQITPLIWGASTADFPAFGLENTSIGLKAGLVGFADEDGPRASILTFSNHPLAFETGADGAALWIGTNDNVGIGTTTPSERLVVAGSFSLTGNILPALAPTTTSLSGNATSTLDTSAIPQGHSIAIGADGFPIIAYQESLQNLVVAKCNDLACNAPTISTVVSGNVGFGTSTISIAISTDGRPFITYQDGPTGELRLAICGNSSCSSGNSTTTVDTIGFGDGASNSIAFAPEGIPVISYYHTTNGELRFATCGTVGTGQTPCINSSVSTSTLDGVGDRNAGQFNSLAIGADGIPVISYYDVTNGNLNVAQCFNSTCGGSAATTSPDTGGDVGQYTSITIGTDGLPIISYYDVTNGDLKVAKCANTGCTTGTTVTIQDSAGDVGRFSSITITTGGLPLIAYYDVTNADLKVEACANASCSSNSSHKSVDTDNNVGEFASISIGTDGMPIIAYYSRTTGNLRFVRCNNFTCQNSSGGFFNGSDLGSIGKFFNNAYVESLWAKQIAIKRFDLAEDYYSKSALEAGEIVALDPNEYLHVNRANPEDGSRVIGIVSTEPALVLSDFLAPPTNSKNYPIALAGRVPVKVNGEGGEIKVGDQIALSSVSGVGRKADASLGRRVIGYALEPFAGGPDSVGKIMVFVNLSDAPVNLGELTAPAQTQSTLFSQVISLVNGWLEGMKVYIVDGFVKLRELVAEKITAKKAVLEKIELKDEDTGETYCVRMKGGALLSTLGKCASATDNQQSEDLNGPSQAPPPPPGLESQDGDEGDPNMIELNNNQETGTSTSSEDNQSTGSTTPESGE